MKSLSCLNKGYVSFTLLIGLLFFPTAGYADSRTGFISSVYVAQGGNYGFRVYFLNVSTMCTGDSSGFAYIEPTNANYGAFVGALLSAYSMRKSVTVLTTLTGSYCRIDEVGVS